MTHELIRQAEGHNIRLKIIPIECLADIRADIEAFSKRDDLNGYQRWIANERYILDLPELDFEPKSIVIAAIPYRFVAATLHFGGKQAHDLLELRQKGIKEQLIELWSGQGFKLEYIHWLPQKRIAVRSGLAEYGRNNIAYVEGFGSFIELHTCLSDLPCGDEYIWRDIRNMDPCNACTLCMKSCPTGAILNDRFLIDNEKCLTSQNEWGAHEFPEWIPKTAHHRLYGCLRCQEQCPKNRGILSNISESIEFSEDETALLLSGMKIEALPPDLAEKVVRCAMEGYYESIPRNLKAMFENV